MTKLDLKLDKTMKKLLDCGKGNHKYVNKINSYGQAFSICKVCHDRQEGYVGGDFVGTAFSGTIPPGYVSGGSIPLSNFNLSTRFSKGSGSFS